MGRRGPYRDGAAGRGINVRADASSMRRPMRSRIPQASWIAWASTVVGVQLLQFGEQVSQVSEGVDRVDRKGVSDLVMRRTCGANNDAVKSFLKRLILLNAVYTAVYL